MAEQTCKDINGNDVNQFVFADDGIVYGLVNSDGSQTTYEGVTISYDGEGDLVKLSSECCTSMNFRFDSNDANCYYREVISNDTKFKVVFNVDENNGAIFTKSEAEECSLNLRFDFLIEYDSTILYNESLNGTNVIDLLNGLDLSVAIEKYGFRDNQAGETYETNKTLIPIVNQDFYSNISINESTGVILSGDKINLVNNRLKNELGGVYNEQITNSDWLQVDLFINDASLINTIINEEVKFSIQVNKNICDFSIILDNIELNKICELEFVETRTVDKSPSFELKRVVDNKKSWVNRDKDRFYDLPVRETDYIVEDERMVINSKEMELTTSIAKTIEEDVSSTISNDITILDGMSSAPQFHRTINISSLLVSDLTTINDSDLIDILQRELIDVKSRKSIVRYPILEMIYERYLQSDGGNKYTYSIINKFVNLLGSHWVDLIEQVIPSTTLWGSANKISNNIFKENKYKYNRYNLLYCNRENEDNLIQENGVEVIVKTIDEDDEFYDKCGNIYIKTFSHDCSTIGAVTIVGNNGTTLNEA